MGKNIRNQLRTSIFDVFSEHKDKKSMKQTDPDRARSQVFSYGTKFQLLDRVNDFCKSLPPDVRKPSDITKNHIVRYLDGKAQTCTQTTVDEYRHELKKIGKIVGQDYSCERVYADRKTASDRGADSVISKDDWKRILDYTYSNPSKSGVCLQLEGLIGVRVSDLAYGIKVEEDRLKIRCKNGKYLYRPITPAIRDVITSPKFQSLLTADNKVAAPKDGSINKYLSRVQDKLGLERHSFHDIRRRIAQDKYDELRSSGLTRSETLTAVSLWLNHGRNRETMLLKSYISNAW